jgi:hypothetical protein
MSGKRVIVLSKPTMLPMNRLRSFFDVVIAEDTCGDLGGIPDIYICRRTDPHINGIFDLAEITKYSQCLYILDYKLVSSIEKVNKKHRSHSLQASMVDIEPASTPQTIDQIPYGLSQSHPGHHLALISGASPEQVYSEYRLKSKYEAEVNSLLTERVGLKPKNILNPNRSQFLLHFKVSDV